MAIHSAFGAFSVSSSIRRFIRRAFSQRAGFVAKRGSVVHSGWPSTSLSLIDEEAVPGPRNAEQYGTFASLDLRLSRKFQVRKGTLLVFVEISNVTNRRNICCTDWDIDDDDQLHATIQDAVNVAKQFHERIELSGIVLTRIDGDEATIDVGGGTTLNLTVRAIAEKLGDKEE